MNKRLTEIVFILDKSGSMAGLEADVIGGFNSMLAKQQMVDGEGYITTVLFDDDFELLHDHLDVKGVGPISEKEYVIGSTTALYDAIGITIQKIINIQRKTAEEYQAGKVVFIIITDGKENASRKYSAAVIKEMIEYQKERYGWEFIFLGANIEATYTARKFGITPDKAQDFHADKQGIKLNFKVMSETITSLREGSEIPKNWKEEIEKDFKSRKVKK